MRLRVARHTTQLAPLIRFYTEIVGLEVLGEFKCHGHYDGVFIGPSSADWHIEFTVSDQPPTHKPDADDLLVFYLDTPSQLKEITEKLKANKIRAIKPQNPYWEINGQTYEDPDGYRIVLALKKQQ